MPKLVKHKKTKIEAVKNALWKFTLESDPSVAKAIQNRLSVEPGLWLGATMRSRLERIAARLVRPVASALKAWAPELVIVDEAHRVKESSSRRTHAVREVCADHRVLLLTGTPIRNRPEEPKALLEMILPAEVWNAMGRTGEELKIIIQELLSRRMIRRLKRDVFKELPPKLRQRVDVRIEATKLENYAASMHTAEENFADAWRKTGSFAEARQAALGHWTKAREHLGVAKVQTGIPTDCILKFLEEKECVIVFAHHQKVLDALEQQLKKADIDVGRLDGNVRADERATVVQRFQAGKSRLFLGSIQAGSESITLTRAETVIFVELDWVPGSLLQAEDRGHRVGQRAPRYHIVHLIAEIEQPPAPKPSEGLTPPVPLAISLPDDYRLYEEEDICSPALAAAKEQLTKDLYRWEEYKEEQEKVAELISLENIDEHMIAALEAKIQLINEVLAEQSDPMIAKASDEQGMARLIYATERRVRARYGAANPACRTQAEGAM